MGFKDMAAAVLPKKKSKETVQLFTRWGEQIRNSETDAVLSEYPRPQLRRDSFICLNGWWKYAFGSDLKPERWDGRILVPFSAESTLSGIKRQLKPGEAGDSSMPMMQSPG